VQKTGNIGFGRNAPCEFSASSLRSRANVAPVPRVRSLARSLAHDPSQFPTYSSRNWRAIAVHGAVDEAGMRAGKSGLQCGKRTGSRRRGAAKGRSL